MVLDKITGLEIARLLHRARRLAPQGARPRIGVVTIPNMVGSIQGFEDILDIELRTYFVEGNEEMERGAQQAIADGMDVILGGDFVNAYCRRLGKRTLFFEGTEDSLRTSLLHARSVGLITDTERRNTAHLQALLDYSFNGILELDPDGVVVRSNDVACKILELERDKLEGQPLASLMPREDAELWLDALTQRRELYASVLNVAGVYVVANAAPVADLDAVEECKDPREIFTTLDDKVDLYNALHVLSNDELTLIFKRFWEDFTYESIADELSSKKSTIHKKLKQIIAKLKSYL